MNRTTIDYGIDLGTTNSAIAVATGATTEIIKNNVDADTTPSAVYINRSGNLWVGQNARSKLADERAEDDVAVEFKRRMGTGREHIFRASSRRMRPEELSAEVLKSLRGDVAQKKNEEITAAVLTVPAAFELPQCEATTQAAILAGFKHAPLVQEPVAAALAYGFQKLDAKAYWLVFDFGGGTFDAALIRSEGGSMSVVNHEGDNFLGGCDIDWAIVEGVLAPRIQKEFRLPEFRRGDPTYKYDLLRLKTAAETAKVDLSRKESTFLEATLRGGAGEARLFETELTRQDIARAAEPIIIRATTIARRVLYAKGLEPSAVEKLIFVGGPTLAPYFRDIVAAHLAIPCDLTVDPLTVVARGAAIFASSQRLESVPAKPSASSKRFSVELIYKPVGFDSEPPVGGKFCAPGDASLAGFTVELVNQQSKWRSGKVALSAAGTFQISSRAEKGVQNVFQIELRDSTGTLHPSDPGHFTYTVGLTMEEQPIIHNMGVAMADNSVVVHFVKGQGLPAKCAKTYRTSTEVRRDTSGSALKIPIVEGGQELADRNILIGSLEIASDKVRRDLPAGTEIEVTLSMDASRLLTVVAYVPLLDEEFPAKIELGGNSRQPDFGLLRGELDREMERLNQLQTTLQSAGASSALAPLTSLLVAPATKELQQSLAADSLEFDPLLKAERALIDFKIKVDSLAALTAHPIAVKEAEGWIRDLETLANQHGTGAEKARARLLVGQVRSIMAGNDAGRLKKKIAELSDVHAAILYRQPSFWKQHFEALAQCFDQMRDPAKATPLIETGRSHLAADRLDELKNIIFLLQDLLPSRVVEQARRGYDSTLLV